MSSQQMSKVDAPLVCIASSDDGLIFADGHDMYCVWKSNSRDCEWSGLRIDSNIPSVHHEFVCGAEVDMRRDTDDPVTPEIMALNDRMADALNKYFDGQRKQVDVEWKRLKVAVNNDV